MKVCNTCGIAKLLSEFHRDKTCSFGVSSSCKTCASERSRLWRLSNRERFLGSLRLCRLNEDKEKKKLYYKEYTDKNKERLKEYRREYYQKNKDACDTRVKAYLLKYPEDRYLAMARYTRKKRNIINGKALVRYKITSVLSDDDWEKIKERFKHTCVGCGKREPEIRLQRDHIIPVSRGGSGTVSNIQPLCGYCNRSKGSSIRDYRVEFVNKVVLE